MDSTDSNRTTAQPCAWAGLRRAWAFYRDSPSTRDFYTGLIVFALGDSISMLILGKFTFVRTVALMIIGCQIYAAEIPWYFARVEERFQNRTGKMNALLKAAISMAFFNPLWIARHYMLISLLTLNWHEINLSMFVSAITAFIIFSPLSFSGNYALQNHAPLKWRFFWGSLLSALMAVCYALGQMWFL